MNDATTIPADRCFWALVPTPERGGAEAARYAVEEHLPIALDDAHVILWMADAGMTAACAVERSVVEDAVRSGVTSLRPSCIPSWLASSERPIELLVGDFLSIRARRLDRARRATIAALTTLSVALACIGLERRRTAGLDRARATDAVLSSLAQEWGPPGTTHLPPLVRLEAAVRAARLSDHARRALAPGDAVALAAALFGAWPRDIPTRADDVSITPAHATISARVASREHAEDFVSALRRAPTLNLEPPQIAAEREGVLLRLRVSGRTP